MSIYSRSPSKSPTKGGAAAALLAGLPDPFAPAPELPEAERAFTASDLIARQAKLEAEAHAAIPFGLGSCTYDKGYIRQPVYACRTCGGGGVCAHCSVGCHADHDLVELFAKRAFRCDCGTPGLFRECTEAGEEAPEQYPPCSLRQPGYDPENDLNTYGQNFQGRFCYCEKGENYSADQEDEPMYQCLACEEWFHEGCTSLVPASAAAAAAAAAAASTSAKDSAATDESATEGAPKASASTRPDALIDQDLFEMLLCSACVLKPEHAILRHYIGARGWAAVVPAGVLAQKKESGERTPSGDAATGSTAPRQAEYDGLPVIYTEVSSAAGETSGPRELAIVGISPEALTADTTVDTEAGDTSTATVTNLPAPTTASPKAAGKRKAEDGCGDADDGARSEKKAKTEATPVANGSACTLPPALPIELQGTVRYDIFLSEGFRDRICRCKECIPKWSALPFVLEEEETYSPPPSDAGNSETAGSVSNASTYDLGVAALSRLPRERIIETMGAYTRFRDELYAHLRPHADTGEVVTEASIREFFGKRLQERS